MCRCAHTRKFFQFFFSELRPFELRNLAKMKDTIPNSLSAQLLLSRSKEFRETFVVMKDLMCRCAYPQEILVQFPPLFLMPLFELKNLTKTKDTTQNSLSAQLH